MNLKNDKNCLYKIFSHFCHKCILPWSGWRVRSGTESHLIAHMFSPLPPGGHVKASADRHFTCPSVKHRRSLARRVSPSANVHVHFQTSCPPTCTSRWLITDVACKWSVNKLSTCDIWHLISNGSDGGSVTFCLMLSIRGQWCLTDQALRSTQQEDC